ncbi:putative 2-hydroxyacid dehydrogenase, partial [Candida tropicalis]
MGKPKVLFIGELNQSLRQFKHFQTKYECIFTELTTKEQLVKDLQTKYNDIVAIYGAWLWLWFLEIGGFRSIIEHAPKSLKIIAFCSVGYDHKDAEIMKQHDIIMTNVPSDGAAEPVADLALYLAISSFRQFQMYNKTVKDIPNTLDIRYQLSKNEFDHNEGKVVRSEGNGYEFGHYLNKRP